MPMILAFQLDGDLQTFQFRPREKVWRLYWEYNGWNVGRERAEEVEVGDWISTDSGDDLGVDEDFGWRRVCGVTWVAEPMKASKEP